MNIISMKMRNPMPFLITTLPVTMSILSALVHGFSRDCYHPGRMGRIIARSAAASTTTVANAPALSGVSLLSPSASSSCTTQSSMPSSTALFGVRNRGLEQNREGATPTVGGMTLYCKAAEDGTSVGDCPFAHYVRLVLEEKGLEYDLKPSTQETKPNWLIEYYEGKMPALRHRKECYVESSVIGSYLEFFFPEPSLTPSDNDVAAKAEDVLEGFFPAVAKFLKDTQDTEETTSALKSKLQDVEDHLASLPNGSFLAGPEFTSVDCRIVPQLYHLTVGIDEFKAGQPSLQNEYPKLDAYLKTCMERPSFTATQYPPSVIVWGWGNARQS